MITHRVYCLIMIDFPVFLFKKHQQHFSSNSHTVRKMLSCLQIPVSADCRGGAAGGSRSTPIQTQQYRLRQHGHVLPTRAFYQAVKSFIQIINLCYSQVGRSGQAAPMSRPHEAVLDSVEPELSSCSLLLHTVLSLSGSISFNRPKLQ